MLTLDEQIQQYHQYDKIVYKRILKNGNVAQSLMINPNYNNMSYWPGDIPEFYSDLEYQTSYVIVENGDTIINEIKTAKDMANLMWLYKNGGYKLKNYAIKHR